MIVYDKIIEEGKEEVVVGSGEQVGQLQLTGVIINCLKNSPSKLIYLLYRPITDSRGLLEVHSVAQCSVEHTTLAKYISNKSKDIVSLVGVVEMNISRGMVFYTDGYEGYPDKLWDYIEAIQYAVFGRNVSASDTEAGHQFPSRNIHEFYESKADTVSSSA